MATLRPAKCYRKIERPYTRQSRKKPRKGYVKGVPGKKINRFWTGNQKGTFSLRAYLVSKNAVQIRHNALESARVNTNKYLEKTLGKDNFYLRVLVYPHHVLRENTMATGAGADRFQTGMRLAFGKPIGVAAQVRENQRIMELRVDASKESVAKEALRRASAKFPTTTRIVLENM